VFSGQIVGYAGLILN